MKRNSLTIELTPFLDVILILLFLVLVQSEGRLDIIHAEAREEMVAAQEAFQEAFVEEMEALRQTALAYDVLRLGLEEDTGVISIRLVVDEGNRDIRWILVEAAEQTRQIQLNWDSFARDNASLALNTALAEGVQREGGALTFIVFQFDSANSFIADYRLISMAIHNQRLHHPHLFSAELDLRQSEREGTN